uniref:Uncharacterized protein n=1 Tax=Rhizophora mucronata TaxID=61149 RepID=A0A2P2R2Z6_RHIMU
MREREMERRK